MISDEAKAGRRTKQFLQSISRHLSGREDCRGLEYKVIIRHEDTSGDDIVEVSPYITVFPNTFNRKETDRRSIAHHVLIHHFPDILQKSNSNIAHVTSGMLVHGEYIYKKYQLTSRRKWRKL